MKHLKLMLIAFLAIATIACDKDEDENPQENNQNNGENNEGGETNDTSSKLVGKWKLIACNYETVRTAATDDSGEEFVKDTGVMKSSTTTMTFSDNPKKFVFDDDTTWIFSTENQNGVSVENQEYFNSHDFNGDWEIDENGKLRYHNSNDIGFDNYHGTIKELTDDKLVLELISEYVYAGTTKIVIKRHEEYQKVN
ncbi:hypothetical protein [Aureivirga sp. CE67]|uniref:hypothetical protein n=1 Tax=Aureivirga sp. CE67 TaxID=1788983 RepID=UPI0018CAFCB1|nr:hypothetical protein [Aureivirga sp. CE67]